MSHCHAEWDSEISPGRMNNNIHWREDTMRFEKAETLHALHALYAQKSFFFSN